MNQYLKKLNRIKATILTIVTIWTFSPQAAFGQNQNEDLRRILSIQQTQIELMQKEIAELKEALGQKVAISTFNQKLQKQDQKIAKQVSKNNFNTAIAKLAEKDLQLGNNIDTKLSRSVYDTDQSALQSQLSKKVDDATFNSATQALQATIDQKQNQSTTLDMLTEYVDYKNNVFVLTNGRNIKAGNVALNNYLFANFIEHVSYTSGQGFHFNNRKIWAKQFVPN